MNFNRISRDSALVNLCWIPSGILRRVLLVTVSMGMLLEPENLLAGELTLSWNDNSKNESGFEIQRSLDNRSYQVIATVPRNTTRFVDRTVEEGGDYWYRVRAYNSAGRSGFTNKANGRAVRSSPVSNQPRAASRGGGGGFAVSSPPGASALPNVFGLVDATIEVGEVFGEFHFSLSDDDTDSPNLTVRVEADNRELFPSTGIRVLGTGLERRVRLTPTQDVGGSSKITVFASDGLNEVSESFVLEVEKAMVPPQLALQPIAQVVSERGEAVFSVLATGDSLSYQWYRNGRKISGATDSIFGYEDTRLFHSGMYSAQVSNEGGVVESDAVELTVLSRLAIVGEPKGKVLLGPSSVRLRVETTGNELSYQWYEGASGDTSSPIDGATKAVFATPVLTEAREYWVRISQATGRLLSAGSHVDSATAAVGYKGERFFYFGDLLPAGEVAIQIGQDGVGVLLARIGGDEGSADEFGVFGRFQANAAGEFAFEDDVVGEVSGSIDGNVAVGSFSNLGIHFEAQVDAGKEVGLEYQGLFAGNVIYSVEGQMEMLFGPSGKGIALLSFDSLQFASAVRMSSRGLITGEIVDEFIFEARIRDEGGLYGNLIAVNGDDHFEVLGSKDGAALKKQLVNTSIRADLSSGEETLLTSFVISGAEGSSKEIMIRALGPALTALGVENAVVDPSLLLYRLIDGDQVLIAENDDWGQWATSAELNSLGQDLGAVSLADSSKDAALFLELPPGIYTTMVSSKVSSEGVALVEVFDGSILDTGELRADLVNISTRGRVGSGSDGVQAGFVVDGRIPKRFLIRAAGKELENYGVQQPLVDTKLTLYRLIQGNAVKIAESDDWQSDEALTEISARLGTFPLEENSQSSALVIWLEPGVYSAAVASASGESGIALVEVYDAMDDTAF